MFIPQFGHLVGVGDVVVVYEPPVIVDRDPGDEHEDRIRWHMEWTGKCLAFYPRTWFEELIETPRPDHDPGDEEPDWQPLSAVSRARLNRQWNIRFDDERERG